MYNILIVDDNKNNRMIVHLLLEDYKEENQAVHFEIDEAENGAIAVNMARDKRYDLIFMDIMMPELNGIDATAVIRKADAKVMIVAVSAIDDQQRQRDILSNGAEDYISKPINADIFYSRLSNYLSLIDARHRQKFNAEARNLFTKEVFNRKLIFMMINEEALSEFWEYYLLGEALRSEMLSDVVRGIYALCDLQRRRGTYGEVIVEESEKMRYFTITQIDALDNAEVNTIIQKNNITSGYKMAQGRITFSLVVTAAVSVVEPRMTVPVPTPKPVASPKPPVHEAVSTAAAFSTSKELQVFDYMEIDDLDEVELYLGKLSSLLLIVGSSDIELHEVEEICAYLAQIAKLLRTYNEAYRIAHALDELSLVIEQYMDTFRENSGALGPLANAFSNDLITWQRMIFHDGAPSVDFLDDTIIANAQMIGAMLAQDSSAEDTGDLDDIFDF